METPSPRPTDARSRRSVRGLEWLVIALLAVVELAAAGTRENTGDPGSDAVEVFETADSPDPLGSADLPGSIGTDDGP